MAVALAFFFGPLGLLYSSITGAVVMFFVNVFAAFTLVLVFFTWPACAIWAYFAAKSYNEKLLASANQEDEQQILTRPQTRTESTHRTESSQEVLDQKRKLEEYEKFKKREREREQQEKEQRENEQKIKEQKEREQRASIKQPAYSKTVKHKQSLDVDEIEEVVEPRKGIFLKVLLISIVVLLLGGFGTVFLNENIRKVVLSEVGLGQTDEDNKIEEASP